MYKNTKYKNTKKEIIIKIIQIHFHYEIIINIIC